MGKTKKKKKMVNVSKHMAKISCMQHLLFFFFFFLAINCNLNKF
jgi:hypothetical protein